MTSRGMTLSPLAWVPVVKVGSEDGWFAARPSDTEDVYKIYAESFRGDAHLRRVLEEAQTIVNDALQGAL